MAAYQACFPAANLDAVRETASRFNQLAAWLKSPAGFLAFQKAFVLSGSGGSGKTHGICDMADRRLENGAYTCVTFGHQFSGEPAEWTRLVEALGLPVTIGKNGILEALNAAGEASGMPLIFCIDALNETRPRGYWRQRFLPFTHEFDKRPFLKLCVSCRTSFLSVSLPQSFPYRIVEHKGFSGIERQACDAFFNHYNLEPPLIPVLQSELSNPLYLKLVCETLRLKGLTRLPAGWYGLAPVIHTFLAEKENQFAAEHDLSPGANIIAGSLLAIASAIAESGEAALPWSKAQQVINEKRPLGATLPVLEWLVRADLLIEDGPAASGLGEEAVLRPAFERFGDFLIAAELLPKATADRMAAEFSSNERIRKLLATSSSVEANAGIVQALSILLPEATKIELPNLLEDQAVREAVLSLTMRALPWRTPDSFSRSTADLVKLALSKDAWKTMDSLLAISAYASAIDAYWTSDLLSSRPIGKRDGFWCTYLHREYEDGGIVKRLIEPSADTELTKLDVETAARWSLMLLWFSAAADRRVKDRGTRATIAIFRAHPEVILPHVERLLGVNDDEIIERVLLSAYGALIAVPNKRVVQALAENLLARYVASPAAFQNAVIRDHIRSIGELARHLGCLGERFNPLLPTKRQKSSDWPLELPTEEQLKQWESGDGAAYYAARSCLSDDFNHYSIGCLRGWMYRMDKPAIGGWILKHAIEELGLQGKSCDQYDRHMVSSSGGGRGKPTWAERIGKKYQWIGLYRLASRLHDNVTREKRSSLDPKPARTPLILEEERKLDPTLSHTIVPDRKHSNSWCPWGKCDLAATKSLDFATWVAKRDDLPSLEYVLKPVPHVGQQWTALTAFPRASEYRPNMEYNTPYRDTWMHLRGYLVPKSQFAKTIKALDGRNYFNSWLPDGGKWLHAFAGEYPWATACNTDPDWYLGASDRVRNSNLRLAHASNQVVIEWEYDATLPSSVYLQVPTKKFFSVGDLWWNGTDGFATAEGKTVFFDPQFRLGRPVSLLADFDDLLVRLDKIGCRLVWTLLGEKRILGDDRRESPRICFSQLAWLTGKGVVEAGERRFFRDYTQDQGFAKTWQRAKF